MKGFFDRQQLKSSKSVIRLSCTSCGLYRGVITPKMQPSGDGFRGILVCGEAPGSEEDRIGKQWQGKAGRELKKAFRKFGLSLFEDAWVTNSVNCRPPSNRDPLKHELNCCRQVILEPAMDKFRPKLVLLFGGSAVHSFVGTSWGSSDVNKIGRWRGWVIPDRNAKAWLCPMYHPSFILRRDSEEVRTVWYRDLERALSYVDTPFPVSEDERKRIRIVKSESDVETILGRIRQGEEGKWICFDYETTGLKPQGDQHKIICVSVATAESTYAFMLPESPTALEQLRRVLGSARIGKAAHNMGFEDTWTNVRLGTKVRRWCWDSKLAAHTLDNRRGVTGLKFQTYVHFGVAGYDDDVSLYLKSKGGGNGVNKIEEFVSSGRGDELLEYCGLDSHFGRKLAALQMDKIGVRTWLP